MASPELNAAFDALAGVVFGIDGVTGIDIGYRDEAAADPNDLALRIYVRDIQAIPSDLTDLTAQLEVPFVVIQRVFQDMATLPDIEQHRPVIGGISVCTERLAVVGGSSGTLGAIGVTTMTNPPIVVGLSNWHVLCYDQNRNWGDKVIQPEPGPVGRLPNDIIGKLVNWAFPESVYSGEADAAICSIDPPVVATPLIADIGLTAGTTTESLGQLVSKRGRTTGLTTGIVTTDPDKRGTFLTSKKGKLPPVNNPYNNTLTTDRLITNQITIRPDFPSSVYFCDHGDSGSVVVDGSNRIIGLLAWGGSVTYSDPIEHGIVTPISVVEQALAVSFGPSS